MVAMVAAAMPGVGINAFTGEPESERIIATINRNHGFRRERHAGKKDSSGKALFDNRGGKGDAAVRLFALTQAGAAAELPFKQSQ